MGKYSLENYERYKTVKCRPQECPGTAHNAGSGTFRTVRRRVDASWETLQAEPDMLLELEGADGYPDRICQQESGIRAIAERMDGGRGLLGVCLAGRQLPQRLLETVCDAFDSTRMFVSVDDGEALGFALRSGARFGILATVSCDPLAVCEAFARQQAQRLWKRAPVLVRCLPDADPEIAGALALQWHALAAEGTEHDGIGWHIALRRVTYPAEVTSGGAFPIRFWWSNSGVSPCYRMLEVRVLLDNGRQSAPVCFAGRPHPFGLADATYNEIAKLPGLEPGVYNVYCGLFDPDTGIPVGTDNAPSERPGWCRVGEVWLDHRPRPELAHAWDGYYPEGYYPLEDPAQPDAEEAGE